MADGASSPEFGDTEGTELAGWGLTPEFGDVEGTERGGWGLIPGVR